MQKFFHLFQRKTYAKYNFKWQILRLILIIKSTVIAMIDESYQASTSK